MRRAAYLILAGALFAVAALAAMLAYVAATESGLRLAYTYAARLLPGELTVESLEGRLIGPIRMRGVSYAKEGLSVDMERLFLDWSPLGLLSLNVSLSGFEVENLRVVLPAEKLEEADAPPLLPEVRLPVVGLDVHEARVRGITIVRGGEAPDVSLDEVALAVRVSGSRILLERLQVAGPDFNLRLEGSVTARDDYPLSLTAGWEARPPGYPIVRGEGRASGTLKRLRLSHRVSEPAAVSSEAVVTDPLGEIGWEGSASVRDFVPRRMDEGWPAGNLSLDVSGGGSLQAFRLKGSFRASGISHVEDVSGSFEVARQEGRWDITGASVEFSGAETRLSAAGSLLLEEKEPAFNLRITWDSLRWPLRGEDARVQSPRGTVTGEGSADAYRFSAQASFAAGAMPEWEGSLRGAGSRTGLTLEEAKVSFLGGVIHGRGSIAWSPELRWSAALRGRDLNPGLHWEGWDGDLGLHVDVSGGDEGDVTVGIREATGLLRGYPLRASGTVGIRGERYLFRQVSLRSGTATVGVDGAIDDRWDLSWKVHAPDLTALHPGASGSLRGRGTLAGLRTRPEVVAAVGGEGLRFRSHAVERLAADVSVDLSDRKPSRVALDLGGVVTGSRRFETVKLTGTGRRGAHTADISVKRARESVKLGLEGAYGDELWQGVVRQVEVSTEDLGLWKLKDAQRLSVSRRAVGLDEVCLSREQARACLQAKWEQEVGTGLRGSLRKVPLELLGPLLPAGVELSGTAEGAFDVFLGGDQDVSGEATVSVSSGSVSRAREGTEKMVMPFRDFTLRVEADGKTVSLRVDSRIEGGSLSAAAVVPLPGSGGEHSGRVRVEVADMAVYQALVPHARNLTGSLQAEVSFRGAWPDLRMKGRITLAEGGGEVPALGLALRDVSLWAEGDEEGLVRFEGRLLSGEGHLRVVGDAVLSAEEGWPVNAAVTGERFTMIAVPEAKIVAGPEIRVSHKGGLLRVDGTIVITEAALRPKDLSGAVSPSEDVVVLREGEAEETPAAMKISGRVRLVLQHVTFQGFGLTGEISGGITLVEEPGEHTTATGELRVEKGLYKAYGQELTIERGNLLYAGGPADNPQLDVVAKRTVGDVTVGLNIRGTLRRPLVSVFSDPPMEQADALSYLLIGRPLKLASSQEGREVYDAAASAGFAGGEFIAKRVGSLFGFEEVRIEEGETPEEATMLLGRYLSPRVYVRYGVGLFEPMSSFLIRYHLTPRLDLQTEYGTESSGDVIYEIDR